MYNYPNKDKNMDNRYACPANNQVLAMAYVPWQTFNKIYNLDESLMYGTVFPELNKPFGGCRGGRR